MLPSSHCHCHTPSSSSSSSRTATCNAVSASTLTPRSPPPKTSIPGNGDVSSTKHGLLSSATSLVRGRMSPGGLPLYQRLAPGTYWRVDTRAASLFVVTLASLSLLSLFTRPVSPMDGELGVTSFRVLNTVAPSVNETKSTEPISLPSPQPPSRPPPHQQQEQQQQPQQQQQQQQQQQCASARYEKMTCPTWDPTQPDGGDDVDYRLRWIYKHQHPQRCSEQNYLIRALMPHIGFGANVVLSVESTMYMAMYTNRIFLLDPDIPFRYADCEKQDWSCYFAPLSNCTIDDAEAIVKARGGIYDQVVLDPKHRVIRTRRQLASVPDVSGWAWYRRTWEHPWWNDFFMFPGDEEILAGGLMYALRPTLVVKKRVEQILHSVLSEVCDFDPGRTISIPIRGSDKCLGNMHVEGGMDGESECFGNLDKYMEMAEDIRRLDPKVNTIILTSEDDRYIKDRHRFEKDGRWRFIVNKGDRERGTGTVSVMQERTQSMADVFVSFFSSLHLQMRGKYYLLNCASNFHLILSTLVKHGGCALTTHPVVYCLNDQYADYKLCVREGHKNCAQGKLEEIDIKSRALGRNITLDAISTKNGKYADER